MQRAPRIVHFPQARGKIARKKHARGRLARGEIFRRLTIFVLTLATAVTLLYSFYTRAPEIWNWPPEIIFKHFAAFERCSAARAVGLAPAFRGQPGYWPHLDADQDGISCEPWKRIASP